MLVYQRVPRNVNHPQFYPMLGSINQYKPSRNVGCTTKHSSWRFLHQKLCLNQQSTGVQAISMGFMDEMNYNSHSDCCLWEMRIVEFSYDYSSIHIEPLELHGNEHPMVIPALFFGEIGGYQGVEPRKNMKLWRLTQWEWETALLGFNMCSSWWEAKNGNDLHQFYPSCLIRCFTIW